MVLQYCKILAALLLVCLVSPLSADMVLSNAIIHFEEGQANRQDIEIENVGDEVMYVAIEPRLVTNPGTGDEGRELINDPREAGLLVTPNKMAIPAGGRKVIRFVNLKSDNDIERIFRVTVKPVVGEIVAQETGVKILVGYEVLVLMQPSTPNYNVVGKREGNTLFFENTGNINVLLREGKQCAQALDSEIDCQPLPGKRLYPGMEWSVELPHDAPVEYYVAIGTKNAVQTYP